MIGPPNPDTGEGGFDFILCLFSIQTKPIYGLKMG